MAQVLYATPNHRVTKARYVTSSDPRGYVPVYEYPLNGQWIMMDIDDGYASGRRSATPKAGRQSPSACADPRLADIVKILESQPDLATKLRRVRGGYLKMQGTWMARDVAFELSRRVAWNIRYDLVPLFGPSFPDSCLSPDQPGYGKVVTRPPTKTRRSRRTNEPCSPPGTTAPLQDSPPALDPTPEISTSPKLFDSPVEGNLSLVPERVFDEAGYTNGGQPRGRSYSHSSGQVRYQAQGWSSLAPIKQEDIQGIAVYDYPQVQFAETTVYPSHHHSHLRRGSVPYVSSSYAFQDVDAEVKHERGVTHDSGYASFSPDMDSPGYGQFSYAQQAQPQAQAQGQGYEMHERSRSDSGYAAFVGQAQSGCGSGPASIHQQGYASAPASARAMTFEQQQQQESAYAQQGMEHYHHAQASAHFHPSSTQAQYTGVTAYEYAFAYDPTSGPPHGHSADAHYHAYGQQY